MEKPGNTATVELKRHHRVIVNDKKGYLIAKRIMDICGALIGLICLSWLFLIVAVLIKLEDPKGPVFFKQVRVGKDGKEFYMYKFRSMVTNAEELLESLLHLNEVSGAMFKMKDDPRITKVGKFIRKTSIDELPQLWNVLKGDMSLVGPRPPLPREVAQYTEYDKQRLLVTPGCTGLWQVSGRNDLGFDEMVELDLKYIRERSLLYDIKIIFKTIKIMIKPNSAY
ncbi:exopolysaccharide biosynthesis polyprenyl glycosylphosphotransferase [Parageobacillus thermantarcticus]|uniref:Exopolysaccharide biosynthesis polyprenyl glycosylphosphotransferase n=1 Tax=Parageobacillus thermantarcticus TaxID=186116 RepID=A0A1I0TB93_9BACL|nr:sugar transferase [Parageobacillus thermantarcticus]SFA49009.1 exopolysaccharide biosynthesis polyprenyl glycosylphosphotransferase [Parageobacillus thermantarcticus]